MKLLFLLVGAFFCRAALAADQPNILFLFADDQRADTISAWGNHLAGDDLRPLWTGEKERAHDSAFLAFSEMMRSVRDERWKLIVYPQINHRQLFDLQADPDETRDVATGATHLTRDGVSHKPAEIMAEQSRRHPALTVEKPKTKELDFTGYQREPDQWQLALDHREVFLKRLV